MSKLSQVNAVIEFTKQVLGERFVAGTDVKTIATDKDQEAISHLIADGMLKGEIDLSDDAKTKYGDRLRSGYVMGMIRNHWKKCLKLNGNVPYVPATRRGSKNDTTAA